MVGHGGSSAGSYLADPTSPIPSHCASIVVTNTLRVNQLPIFLLSLKKLVALKLMYLCCRFVGGEMNTCYNAVDRHVDEGNGDQVAIIHDSPMTHTIQSVTYAELQKQVI